MAEAIVSRVLEKLSSVLEEEVRLMINVRGEVQNLISNFRAIKAVLEDAERQQMEGGKASVRDWLCKLKEVSYDSENVLDKWSTAICKSKLEKKKVCSFIPSPSFCLNRGKLIHETAHEILELKGRLDVIAHERETYDLKVLSVERPIGQQQTTSGVDLAVVCGRDKDKERIVDILLNEGRIGELGSTLDMISIVGVGGIGKTTLAQLAFNDERVKSHFAKRIWVCVSDPFDELRVAKAILTSLDKDARQNLAELQAVLERLKNLIERKKFLLVLDDVWTDRYGEWDQLKNWLSCGSLGSKILVTTRKENVAKLMGCSKLCPVEQLSEEEGWSLFCKIAFFQRSDRGNLEEIGRKIARKCKGLPLALKTMGGLMLLKKSIEEWQCVLHSEIWELEVAEEGLFRPLMFSYHDLPSHLKQCFSYCAIFPKDYVIKKKKLIELWMAQGFLKGTQPQDMEVVGEEYFNDLSMRSFFQDFEKDENGDIINCKMHDIVHDFTRFLTRGECLTVEAGSSSSIEGFNESARHVMLMIQNSTYECPRIYDAKNLHTLLVDGVQWYNVDLLKLFDKLKCLRILKCQSERINKCPKQIRNLIHLRSLDLSRNSFLEELPEAVCDLYNLLMLDISGCVKLRSLPRRMGNLINLWHLQNESTDSVEFMPKGIEKLPLRKLSSFVVHSGGKGVALSELGNMIHLRGELEIRGLRNVRDKREAEKVQLRNMKGLTALFLTIGWTLRDESQVFEASVLVLEALEPHLDLERLQISVYNCRPTPTLRVWPSWIVSLTKLKFFSLRNCVNVEQLPPLWKLPSLETLYLKEIGGVKTVGVEFLGIETSSLSPSSSSSSVVAFPNLKSLTFTLMEEWEEWDYGSRGEEDIKIMPRLSSLTIFGCEKLKMLPVSILQSTTLQHLTIAGSPVISSRCKKEYKPHISRIPEVQIW